MQTTFKDKLFGDIFMCLKGLKTNEKTRQVPKDIHAKYYGIHANFRKNVK
jgi:ssRNA-specific RNase YbeY (16S rRNA maturation enzyme)